MSRSPPPPRAATLVVVDDERRIYERVKRTMKSRRKTSLERKPGPSDCMYETVRYALDFRRAEPAFTSSRALAGIEGSGWSDPRACTFCGSCGDEDQGLPRYSQNPGPCVPCAGRLLPVGLSQPGKWAHMSCALWSSEVYENAYGKLFSVQKGKSVR